MKLGAHFATVALSMLGPSALAQRIAVTVAGKPLVFADQAPVMRQGRVLVPLRGIFERLGAGLDWYPETRKLVAMREGRTVSLIVGETDAYVDEKLIILDSAPILMRGRIMVPLRFVGQGLGAQVHWNRKNRSVTITGP